MEISKEVMHVVLSLLSVRSSGKGLDGTLMGRDVLFRSYFFKRDPYRRLNRHL